MTMTSQEAAPLELLYDTRSPMMPWFDRIDPIHEVNWTDLVSTEWSTISAYQHKLEVDRHGFLSHRVRKQWSPISRSDRALYNGRAILIMALLHEWNQLTTFQLAAFLGEGRRRVWNTVSELYAAGMVRRLIPDWWQGSNPDESGSGSVWRIDRQSWTTEKWFDNLEPLEWMLATNNVDPMLGTIGSNTPTALRHNLATIEIVLKAMEVSPGIIGAWGEGHANASIFYDESKYELDDARNNVGDAILITKAGKIIIFEVSGANRMSGSNMASNKIVEKAAAWTAACGKSPLDVNVIFVDVSRKAKIQSFYSNVDYGIQKVSEKYASQSKVRRRGAQKIFACDSQEWFPIARGIAKPFERLESLSTVTGEITPVITENDLQLDNTNDVVINTLSGLHTPWWVHRKVEKEGSS